MDHHPVSRAHRKRRAFSLIEVLVATAITLVIVAALAQAFATVSNTVALNRASIEMAGRMRGVTMRLEHDLHAATVWSRTRPDGSTGPGYFEYYEGPRSDFDSSNTSLGDYDDVLMFTATGQDRSYVGRFLGAPTSSRTAEIIWWTQIDDTNGNNQLDAGEDCFLYRRVLLVLPNLVRLDEDWDDDSNPGTPSIPAGYMRIPPNGLDANLNDISVRIVPTARGNIYIANSLVDLADRRNRAARASTNFPAALNLDAGTKLLDSGYRLAGDALGEDVIANGMLAFDVQTYDSEAPLFESGGEVIAPGDPGYAVVQPTGSAVATGAYVDLGYANKASLTISSAFANLPNGKSQLGTTLEYDTWSTSYENDGINQDGDSITDEGTNGLDDDGFYGVDDPAERETGPPYPEPLHGLRIRLRMIEPSVRQVRQSSVIVGFHAD